MTTVTSVELAVGQKLGGRYIVHGILAKGGMSTVYAATDTLLSRAVAVKLMSVEMLNEPEGLARFRHESRASAQLRTPRVPQIFDIGVLPEGNPYLVMERLDGKDLAQTLMERKALPIDFAVDMILQTCDALAEVHARGMVHRDLKPANLFVTTALDGSPFVKVLDFGISKLLEPKKDALVLTRPGHAVGTPEYMSPERLEVGTLIDPRADIWSLGVILYEIATGTALFAGKDIAEVATNVRSMELPRLSSKRNDATRELDMVLVRCLARNREARYADVGALAIALAPFGPPGSVTFAERIARTMERARGIPFLEEGADAPAPSTRDIASAAAVAAKRLESSETLGTIDVEEAIPTIPRESPRAWPPRRIAAVVTVFAALSVFLYALARGRPADATEANASVASSASVASDASVASSASAAATSAGGVGVAKASAARSDDTGDDVDDVDFSTDDIAAAEPSAEPASAPSASASVASRVSAPGRNPAVAAPARPRPRPQHGVRLALDRPLAAGTTIFVDGAELQIAPKKPARVTAGPHLVKALSGGRTVWASKINGQEGQLVILRIPESYSVPQE